MNGAERVFTRVRRSFKLRSYNELDDLLGVRRGWSQQAAHHDSLTDAAIIVINEATCISIRELLDLRAKRLVIRRIAGDKRRGAKKRGYTPRRALFEKWAIGEGLYTRRDGEGYFDAKTQGFWRCWSAARSL